MTQSASGFRVRLHNGDFSLQADASWGAMPAPRWIVQLELDLAA